MTKSKSQFMWMAALIQLVALSASAAEGYPGACAGMLGPLVESVVAREFSPEVVSALVSDQRRSHPRGRQSRLQRKVYLAILEVVRGQNGQLTVRDLNHLLAIEVFLQTAPSVDPTVPKWQQRQLLWNWLSSVDNQSLQTSQHESLSLLQKGFRASIRRLVDVGELQIGKDWKLRVP